MAVIIGPFLFETGTCGHPEVTGVLLLHSKVPLPFHIVLKGNCRRYVHAMQKHNPCSTTLRLASTINKVFKVKGFKAVSAGRGQLS